MRTRTLERGRAWARFAAAATLLFLSPLATTEGGAVGETQSRSLSYRLEEVPPRARSFLGRFDDRQLGLLEKLNRADREHLPRQKLLLVPERWDLDESDYSPLPRQYAAAEPHSKALVVHQPSQVFGAYEGGRLVRWGPVSSGRKTHPTPSGLFHLNWRSRGRASTFDPDWFMRWYFNFENKLGLSFHQFALPGRPASHACVRLLERDARWLFAWGEGWTPGPRGWTVLEPGTPVLIVGDYDFGGPPPWLSPEGAGTGIELPAEGFGPAR
ncbi:MAG: L,D-transpeptidase [Deltaproteobacteria bacterium]|nr:L,D-transpeptidase [Deltaproteobacteria bacterium]